MTKIPVSPALVGFLAVLFSSAFTYLGAHGLYRDYQFNGHTGKSTATIESLSTSSKGAHGEVDYSYSTPGGEVQAVEMAISLSSYYRLHRGDRVAVKYLLDVPGESRLDDPVDEDWQWQQHERALGVGLFFTSIGLFPIWIGWRKKA